MKTPTDIVIEALKLSIDKRRQYLKCFRGVYTDEKQEATISVLRKFESGEYQIYERQASEQSRS